MAYDAKKYYNGDNAPEYNIQGDSSNGRMGSYTPGAIGQRTTQTPSTGAKNPYGEILNYLKQPSAIQPERQYANMLPGEQQPTGRPGGINPITPSFNPTAPKPLAFKPSEPADTKMAIGGPGAQNPITPSFTPQTPAQFDQYGVRLDWSGVPAKPNGTEDPAIAAQWYSWAIPGITAQDVTAYRTSGFNGHIADWWRAGKPNVHAQNAQPQAGGANGMDADAVANWRASRQQQQTPRQSGQPATSAPAAPPATPPPFTPTTPETPPVPPSQPTEPAYAQQMGMSDTVSELRKLLDPSFQMGQDELARAARANAALTGQIDSGGFGTNLGKAQAALAGDHSKYLSDQAVKVSEADKERGVQRYKIDTDKFVAQIQNDTARYGIKTNADLERYLGDKKLELEKYGIDVNNLLERYKSDMAAATGRYSADAGVSAAGLQAAAQAAASEASARASMYNADLDYNASLARTGLDQYMYENPGFRDVLDAYIRMSPEQLASSGMGNIQWPNWIFGR